MKAYKEGKDHGTPEYPFVIYENNSKARQMIIPLHWHNEIELIYITEGQLSIKIDDQSYIGEQGDIFIINKEALHEMGWQQAGAHYYAIVFCDGQLSFSHPDQVQKQYIEPITYKKLRFCERITKKDKGYEALSVQINRLIKINSEKNEAYQLGTKSALLETLYLLISSGYCYQEECEAESDKGRKIREHKKVIDYVNLHYDEKLSLERMSKAFNMSETYFCSYFKEQFGHTLIDYINRLRIEKAMALLEGTTDSILQISELVGFEQQSYFTRKFKEIVGISPSMYRKQNQK